MTHQPAAGTLGVGALAYPERQACDTRDYAATGVWTLHAPMLALSSPDPALAFPPGTTLRPQLFIRNNTPKPRDAALRFNWRTAATGKAPGPQLHLLPYQPGATLFAHLAKGDHDPELFPAADRKPKTSQATISMPNGSHQQSGQHTRRIFVQHAHGLLCPKQTVDPASAS